MSRRGKIITITAAVLLLAAVVVLVVRSPIISRTYVANCYYVEKKSFDRIAELSRGYYEDGESCIKINSENGGEEILSLMSYLGSKYQDDSDFPVFTAVDVYFDNEGDMTLDIQVRKIKIANADGIDTPDVLCYDLVYADEDYSGSLADKLGRPFFGRWFVWSYDSYSG